MQENHSRNARRLDGGGEWGQSKIPPHATYPRSERAYENAEYVAFGEPELVIRIGQRERGPRRADGVPRDRHRRLPPAANPDGEKQSDEENEAAHQELLESDWLIGYATYEGEGRDPKGEWKPEPSVLVVGLPRDDATAVGLGHAAENAIVFIEKGKAPELVELV
jgi:hypothetical protein